MVQLDVTIERLSGLTRISQDNQPVGCRLAGVRPLQGREPLMQTAWSDVMIMPDGQERQHASREGAMHGQMGPHDAVPILHSTAGAHSALPSVQQGLSCFSPSRIKALQQFLGAWTQQGAALPCPGKQINGPWTQSLTRLLFLHIDVARTEHH